MVFILIFPLSLLLSPPLAFPQREWDIRFDQLPTKIYDAILKVHAITIVMRVYEAIADRFCDDITIGDLTRDSFKAGIDVSSRIPDKKEVSRQMREICFWSNVIAFLADYTVHQVILIYGYAVYYRAKRNRQRKNRAKNGTTTNTDSTAVTAHDDDALENTMALSFILKSSKLVASRAFGLFASSFGGAWGTTFWPGWGTTFGISMADSGVASIFDMIP